MGTKKVSYMGLLKEAISEFDTSKNVDVKGPFLDPILGYDGGGELPTHKDAASILERYYFKEENDDGVQVEHKDDAMPEVPPKEDGAAKSLKKDIEKAVADDETPERDAAQDTKLGEDADVDEAGEDLVEAEVSESDDIENAVIEKLISEMEEVDDAIAEEVKIGDDNPTEPAGAPEEDLEKTLPDRKDDHEASVKAAKVSEAEEAGEEADDDAEEAGEEAGEEGEEEEKELDVDKEVKKEAVGPDLRSSAHDNPEGTAEVDELEEAFAIFSEAIEEEDEGVEKKD